MAAEGGRARVQEGMGGQAAGGQRITQGLMVGASWLRGASLMSAIKGTSS